MAYSWPDLMACVVMMLCALPLWPDVPPSIVIVECEQVSGCNPPMCEPGGTAADMAERERVNSELSVRSLCLALLACGAVDGLDTCQAFGVLCFLFLGSVDDGGTLSDLLSCYLSG